MSFTYTYWCTYELNSPLELSQIRAEILRKYIINKFGIDGSRIISKGFGSDKPVATNKTAAGRSKNRRLDVIFSCE